MDHTHTHRPSIGHIHLYNALKHGPDKKIRGIGPYYRQCGRVRESVRRSVQPKYIERIGNEHYENMNQIKIMKRYL